MDLSDGMWAGQRCFIVGGGPSLRDFDWSRLDGENWIGVNAAWQRTKPPIALIQDKRCLDLFLKEPGFRGVPCIVYKHKAHIKDNDAKYKGILTYDSSNGWPTSLKHGLHSGNNAGLSALSLADILGADPIYLLGFDMNWRDGRSHWHDGIYPDKWRQSNDVYKTFIRGFGKISRFVRGRVVNLNPDSGLDCFEKAHPDTVWVGGADEK